MYDNPTPVAVGIIPSTTPGQILLVERSDGGVALPGGYIDRHEDTCTAVTREVFEETGLRLDAHRWQLFFSSTTADNKLLLFSYYRDVVALDTQFVPNAEVIRVMSAPVGTVLKFPLHAAAVQMWRATYRNLAVQSDSSTSSC